MGVRVERRGGGHRLAGPWAGVDAADAFLGHIEARAFSPATVRSYAFDLLNLARFLEARRLALRDLGPTDILDWIDWQRPPRARTGTVVAFGSRGGAAPASVRRRVAAARAFLEHQVLAGARASNPVPAPGRGAGLRPKARGPLGHVGPGRTRGGGRLVRQERRLPESLDPADVRAFLADLRSHRDRAIVPAMVLGGLRAAEVRGLRLADVDQGRRTVRVTGKGGRERIVPVDRAFFAELAAYLGRERPAGLATPECFVVLHGPTAGGAITEAGLRSLFRHHRDRSGALRVRPHRLRHTYGTELASAGIDLLVLRDLMGHASPETTAAHVHLSSEHLAAEHAAAREPTLDVADTVENMAAFGRPGASRGARSAFPQLRIVALAECSTHALFAARMGPCTTGEVTLAKDLVSALAPGMLCLADRGFTAHPLFATAAATGADLLWRARGNALLPVIERHPDGSYGSELVAADDRHRERPIPVRVIEHALDDPGLPGGEDARYRLVTTILDPARAPAAELAALHPQRWEFESVLDELKTHQRGPRVVLRSKTPDGVRQEAWGYLLTHYAIRALMTRAAGDDGVDPDRISFTRALRAARRSVRAGLGTAARALAVAVVSAIAEVSWELLPERRLRTAARVVKRKMSSYGVKRPEHRLWPQPTLAPGEAVRVLGPPN